MWPQTLEMSRDECRGMLRRLELESYSHIISVFRAQGTLSEPKAKVLEELRQLFHITQDRHRAEVRRASNDEQLCTIAENVCGPNTWQEWSREGRRTYPMLPRINPQTALTIVANDMAAKVYRENAQLARPSETGKNISEALADQVTFVGLKHSQAKIPPDPPVVMEEPFKVPDLPNEVKKATQKRKENDGLLGEGKVPHKKRSSLAQQSPLQHLVGHEEHLSAEDLLMAGTPPKPSAHVLQQRHFYQQQQKHKQKLAAGKRSGPGQAGHANHGSGKRGAAPAKTGRRTQKQMQQQQKLQQQQQMQQQQQQQKVLLSPEMAASTSGATTSVPIHHLGNHLATTGGHYNEVEPHVEYILDEALKSVAASPTPNYAVKVPKQNMPSRIYGPEVTSPTGQRQFLNSPLALFKEKQAAATIQAASQAVHSQIITPVKKYIVEERVGPPLPSPTQNISTANLPLAPQIISVQQIPAPVPLSGAKMKAAGNSSGTATLLPAGTKLTPKKVNLLDLDSTPTKLGLGGKPLTPNTPTVRLLPFDQHQQQQQQHQQQQPHLSNLTKPIPKYLVEDRPPLQTIAAVAAAATPLSSTPASTASVIPTSSATVNIIKHIPAASLNNTLITPLAASGASNTPTSAAHVPANTTVFRKAPANLNIKSLNISGPAGPQILSNIKLTPAPVSSPGGQAGGPTLPAGTFNIKQVPSSALRNIKFCSPNGKVFVQSSKIPAGSIIHKLNNASVNVNATSTSGSSSSNSTSTSSNNNSNTISLSSLSGSGAAVGSGSGSLQICTAGSTGAGPISPLPSGAAPQRITIQKMQLLAPNQVISSAAGGTSGTTTSITTPSAINSSVSTVGSKLKPTTLTFTTGGKNNLVFLPASAAANMRTVTLGKTGLSPVTKQVGSDVGKTNVLVIGSAASGTTQLISKPAKPTQQTQQQQQPPSNQLITEDTPIDIINMPIIVADNNGAASTGGSAEAKMLKTTSTPAVGSQQLVVLNTTDWEMELDQASKTPTAATAAAMNRNVLSATTKLSDMVLECTANDHVEEVDAEEEIMTTTTTLTTTTSHTSPSHEQLNNRIIEITDDDGSDIEYVDMDIEQPMEMDGSKIISTNDAIMNTTTTTTTTPTKAPLTPINATLKKSFGQATTAAATTTTMPMITTPTQP